MKAKSGWIQTDPRIIQAQPEQMLIEGTQTHIYGYNT